MSRVIDRAFAAGVAALALLVPLTLAAITLLVVSDSRLSLERFGLSYFTTTTWDPQRLVFGAASYVYGTLVTTVIAVLLAAPIAIGTAVYLTEFAPRRLRAPVAFVIEMLAYIPSIIYGLWGFFILVPFMRGTVEPFLQATLGRVPVVGHLFSGTPIGLDLLTAGVILAIMVTPILLAISREVLLAVPPTQREAMIGLGATRWEAVSRAVLPYARPGIIGGVILGVARAFGETMAVTMVVGNSSREISGSLFAQGYTMASAIANQFIEADSQLYFSAVVEIALVLLVVALITNTLARVLIRRAVAGRPTGALI
ncbi:MAG: phosphate ABC transporter permease subunit PstC [Alphaproteobacteria bacterium]|nr:phosphate ABC transporter permease subunit PstC [Alphaproteobacteria bacterium]